MNLLIKRVEYKIRQSLSDVFSLIFDGWSECETRCVAIFAHVPSENERRYDTYLLKFSPFEKEWSQGAEKSNLCGLCAVIVWKGLESRGSAMRWKLQYKQSICEFSQCTYIRMPLPSIQFSSPSHTCVVQAITKEGQWAHESTQKPNSCRSFARSDALLCQMLQFYSLKFVYSNLVPTSAA